MSRIVYDYWRSSAGYRVRIALNLKGLEYERAPMDLRKGAQQSVGYRIINPQGLIPFLIDGDIGLHQSLAIIEYLDEKYPEPKLLPGDIDMRARIRAAALMIACDIHPLNNLRVQKWLKHEMAQEDAAIEKWLTHWIATGFQPLEEMCEGRGAGTGPYLFGDQPTMADILLVPQMYNARRIRMDLSAFPRLVEIDKALQHIPAFAAARPERQGDADH